MSRIPSRSPTSQCGRPGNGRALGASSRTTGLSASAFPKGTSGSMTFGIHRTSAASCSSMAASSFSMVAIRSPTSRMRAFTSSVGGPPLLALFRSARRVSVSPRSFRPFSSFSMMRSSGASKPRAFKVARTRSGSSRMRSMGRTAAKYRAAVRCPHMAADISEVVLVAFEGPDRYSFVGGLATRMNDLAEALIKRGRRVRQLFVGDPSLPARELRNDGALLLERWGQWITRYHPKDVYDGEDGKWRDFSRTVPPHLLDEVVVPAARQGKRAVLLFEDWQTASAAINATVLAQRAGLRGAITPFWNANNTYGFGEIDFRLL